MDDYKEQIKLRIIAKNLDKPEELYPLLIEALAEEKDLLASFLNTCIKHNRLGKDPYTVLDVGGGNGDLVYQLDIDNKYVVDKRSFDSFKQHSGVRYLLDPYSEQHSRNTDVVIMCEFLHLFNEKQITEMLIECKAKFLVVIENVPDDFLDLRLRLWSHGACIDPLFMNALLGLTPYTVNNHYVWIKELNHGY